MFKQFQRFLFHQYSKLALFWYTRLMLGRLRSKNRPSFSRPQAFCLFAGYPRSGHTLIGALLNAHPEMLIAHELNVLKYVKRDYDRDTLYAKLVGRDKWFAARGNVWTGYSYKVPGQWQGRFTELKVIGDKRGGRTSRELYHNPELLDRLQETVDIPLKIIHIIRNPFDNIATRARGGNYYNREVNREGLQREIERHFKEVEAIDHIRKENKHEIYELRHEDFIEDPGKHLADMCHFLGVEPYPDYIDACLSILRKSTHKSRHKIEWDQQSIDTIYEHSKKYDFLQNYSFDN